MENIENIITIIVSAILSGIFATIITLWWQNKSEKTKMRREIFTTLMAYRFNISHAESVKALNCVQAVFFDCEKVKQAWIKFKASADKQPFDRQNFVDAHITLLEEIAKVLKYKKINWQDIKDFYYPERLAQETDDTETLRKAQIEVAKMNLNSQYASISE